MSNGNELFGWDLLYKSIESTINQKSDMLFALLHFVLVKFYDFQCVGVGEDKTMPDHMMGSETLPEGWNDCKNRYALRYIHDNKLYLLLGHKNDKCFIMNLLDIKTNEVSNIAFNPEEVVKSVKGLIHEMIPDAIEIIKRYREEIVKPVLTCAAKEATTQTETDTRRDSRYVNDPFGIVDPLRIGGPRRPFVPFSPFAPHAFGYPDVGSGDLDPLGRGGSGSLFQLPNQNLRPRFDPFGPPNANIPSNPNPDHLQPPNFGGNNYFS